MNNARYRKPVRESGPEIDLHLITAYDFVIQEVSDETRAGAGYSLAPLESCRKLRKAGQGRIEK